MYYPQHSTQYTVRRLLLFVVYFMLSDAGGPWRAWCGDRGDRQVRTAPRALGIDIGHVPRRSKGETPLPTPRQQACQASPSCLIYRRAASRLCTANPDSPCCRSLGACLTPFIAWLSVLCRYMWIPYTDAVIVVRSNPMGLNDRLLRRATQVGFSSNS